MFARLQPILAVVCVLGLFAPRTVIAHFLNMTRGMIEVDPAAGTVELTLSIDLTRLVGDPVAYHHLSTLPRDETQEAEARIVQALSEKMTLIAGDEPLGWNHTRFTWPDLPLEKFTEPWAAPMAELDFRAILPPEATKIRLATTNGLAIEYPLVITLRTGTDAEAENATSLTRWLEPGQSSPILAFEPVATKPDSVETANTPPAAAAPTPADTTLETARRYLVLGFEHILPKGLDHILFVLGLFFLSHRWRPLLLQVSVFTIAHTLTLALTAIGFLPYLPNVVEPLIAASIAYVGLENLWRTELRRSRLVVIFAFGLIHGMGFAGMLNAIGLPAHEFFVALISFNLGVEAGQLTVLAGAFLLCAAFFHCRWYREGLQIPASLTISMIALFWFGQRVF